jgi:hypothetical protein
VKFPSTKMMEWYSAVHLMTIWQNCGHVRTYCNYFHKATSVCLNNVFNSRDFLLMQFNDCVMSSSERNNNSVYIQCITQHSELYGHTTQTATYHQCSALNVNKIIVPP